MACTPAATGGFPLRGKFFRMISTTITAAITATRIAPQYLAICSSEIVSYSLIALPAPTDVYQTSFG